MSCQSHIRMNERSFELPGRDPLLPWLIFTGVSLFAFVLLWYFGLIERMVASDHTYISSIIALLYVASSLHCLWRILVISREGDAALKTAQAVVREGGLLSTAPAEGKANLPSGLLAAHIRDLVTKAALQGAERLDQTLLLRVLAARLRGSNQFGAFASDTLMKLGLLGTIIGFIMMLAPIAGLDPENREAVRSSMSLMSAGMAVAMYTTLVGLAGSILLKVQYSMLDSATAKIFAFAVDLTEVHVVSALDSRAAAE
jgi:biopolymer transport protein ExbB/TolQ